MTSMMHSEVGSIPVLIDPHVPLVATRKDINGHPIEVRALFWVIFGRIHVHPDRLEEFRLHITSSASHAYPKASNG